MVPLFRPEVQENRKKEIRIELGLQQCQMKKRLKRMPNKRKYIIEKNMKVHQYMFYFEPYAYITTLALTKKKVSFSTVFLFLHTLRPGGNVGNKKFDSCIWEPDDELLAAQEGTFEYLFLNMVPFEWILYEG